MWAHKVIEQLGKTLLTGYDNVFKHRIKSAVKFYFETPISIENNSSLSFCLPGPKENDDFIDAFAISLPYNSILIEYIMDSHDYRLPMTETAPTFCATLIHKTPKNIKIANFSKFPRDTDWHINSMMPIIDFTTNTYQMAVLRKLNIGYVPVTEIENTDRFFNQTIFLIRLLNCKNVEIRTVRPDPFIQKKRKKKGKLPLFTYKTLAITVPGEKRNGNGGKSTGYNRIHLCRGHFKTYTKEKPLFGKYTGTYWWQPSVRGNKKRGVVIKDYKVKKK